MLRGFEIGSRQQAVPEPFASGTQRLALIRAENEVFAGRLPGSFLGRRARTGTSRSSSCLSKYDALRGP